MNDKNKNDGLEEFLAIRGHAISSSSMAGLLGEKRDSHKNNATIVNHDNDK